MELYIFNQSDRQLAGIIEAFEYLRWTRRYSRCGSFELKAVATDENLAMLQIGNILWKNDDEEAGLIEFVQLTMQEQEFIVVSGRFATSFLARRIRCRHRAAFAGRDRFAPQIPDRNRCSNHTCNNIL